MRIGDRPDLPIAALLSPHQHGRQYGALAVRPNVLSELI